MSEGLDSGPLSFDDIVIAQPDEDVQGEAVVEDEGNPEEGEEESEVIEEEGEEESEEVKEDMEEGPEVDMGKGGPAILPGKLLSGENTEGEKVDIHTGTYITIPVDGVKTKVQLQELINGYAGHVAYDKKFSELHNERVDFGQKQEVLNSHLTKIFAKADDLSTSETQEGKREAAIEVLRLFGQLTGGDSFNLVTSLRKAFIEEASSMTEMTDVERERYEFDLERGFHTKQEAAKVDATAQEAKFADYNKQAVEITDSYGIDKQEFLDVKLELEELVKDGKLTNEVTPKSVLEYRTAKLVQETLLDTQPDLAEDKQLFNRLVDYALSDKLSKEDLRGIIAEASGQSQKTNERKKRINKKVKGKVTNPPKKAEAKEVQTFSDSSELWDIT